MIKKGLIITKQSITTDKGLHIVKMDTEKRFNWNNIYYRRKQVREMFIFGCDFQDGVCRHRRGMKSEEKNIGCCHGCATKFGFHKIINPDSVKHYIKLYNSETGFWRPRGCILDDKYKSTICLSYSCNHLLSTIVRQFLDDVVYKECL